jgi:hypothetical protein
VSSYLTIATVTASLRHRVQEAITADVPNATVTTTRPGAATGASGPHVGIYLYRVTPNVAARNADLPTRSVDGRLVRRPRAALDLHYLLTFTGDEQSLEPQRLLGSVVRALHTAPIIDRDLIRRTITDRTYPFLSASDLGEEPEQVKLAPAFLSLEETSHIWSVFFQTPYVLSAAWDASVVFVEGKETPRRVLPVQSRHIHVGPIPAVIIDVVEHRDGPPNPIVVDSPIRLTGHGFGRPDVRVKLADSIVAIAEVSDTELVVDLSSVLAWSLRAGVQPIQVTVPLVSGAPQNVESNIAPFVLHPRIETLGYQPPPRGAAEARALLNAQQGHAVRVSPPFIRVRAKPVVGARQRAELLLTRVDGDERSLHTLKAPDGRGDDEVVEFPSAGVAPGTWLAILRVDGADSPLAFDPEAGQYVGPTVVIE